ncbi:hypothetical protein [Halorubellus salinus]|uniref:hypothetical protein n=1 Tax=Halorubellus salinus TaxID=755309 RepID=UPI001D06A8AD|nr:hypothetical protein [Halorubellus salinus]
MTTHGRRSGGPDRPQLPPVFPVGLTPRSRLSHDLGSRVIDDDATRIAAFEYTTGGWALAAFDVTEHTVVLRVRTPAGRERFYGAARAELDDVLPAMSADPRWQPCT